MKIKLSFRIWVDDEHGFMPYETDANALVELTEEQSQMIAKGLNQGQYLKINIVGYPPSMSWNTDKHIWEY